MEGARGHSVLTAVVSACSAEPGWRGVRRSCRQRRVPLLAPCYLLCYVTCTMQRTSFESLDCPIARSLECIGEWWSILILRDAFLGASRFDDFQKRLGIAPNMLARRLRTLTERGVLERRQYSERPP